jgi:hypothetical protein
MPYGQSTEGTGAKLLEAAAKRAITVVRMSEIDLIMLTLKTFLCLDKSKASYTPF